MFCRKDPRKILILANRSLVGARGGRGSSPAGSGGADRRRRGLKGQGGRGAQGEPKGGVEVAWGWPEATRQR